MTDKTYRVVVRDSSESYASNGVIHDTIEEAMSVGKALYDRWTACRSMAVIDSDLPRDVDSTYWSHETVMASCHYHYGE